MLGTEMKAKFSPKDYDVFAGLDVDKKHIDVTFCGRDQDFKSLKMPYSADHLLAYTHRHFPGQRVAFAYEAGPTGYGLYDQLSARALLFGGDTLHGSNSGWTTRQNQSH